MRIRGILYKPLRKLYEKLKERIDKFKGVDDTVYILDTEEVRSGKYMGKLVKVSGRIVKSLERKTKWYLLEDSSGKILLKSRKHLEGSVFQGRVKRARDGTIYIECE